MSLIDQALLNGAFLAALGVSVVAGLMRGFAGFGSAMLMAPIFAILFGPVQAISMVMTMELIVSAQLVPRALTGVEWKFVGPMGAAAVLAMPVGNWILGVADPDLLARVMAGFVLFFALIVLSGWRYGGEKSLAPTLVVGALSGALVGATSMGGPPVLLYMLIGQDTAHTNRDNAIIYFAIVTVALGVVMAVSGYLSWVPVVRALALVPTFVLFTWVGARLFAAGDRHYRVVALLFLCCVGLYGLLR